MIYRKGNFCYIECSICGSYGAMVVSKELDSETRRRLRKEVHKKGWTTISDRHMDRDLCDAHSKHR
jgi:hypothetical protein